MKWNNAKGINNLWLFYLGNIPLPPPYFFFLIEAALYFLSFYFIILKISLCVLSISEMNSLESSNYLLLFRKRSCIKSFCNSVLYTLRSHLKRWCHHLFHVPNRFFFLCMKYYLWSYYLWRTYTLTHIFVGNVIINIWAEILKIL